MLSNACKFTKAGRVELSVFAEGDRVVFRVWDEGIGMSAEQLDRVFKPYTQADASIERRFGGTGLGLALTRAICVALGGAIEARSAPGRGSTFEIRLPRR